MTTVILVTLFFCHFLADYTHLSMAFMLNAKRLGTPLYPILLHALIHASLMLVCIVLFFGFSGIFALGLFLFQLITHFLIDVWKGKMNYWYPSLQSSDNKWHWVIFGFDQFLHAMVIIIMTSLMSM